MTRPLIIGDGTLAAVRSLRERAAANPVNAAEVKRVGLDAKKIRDLKLSDRPPGFERKPGERIEIPVGFTVAYTVEQQPSGLCGHLSVSVDRKGKVPHPAAVEAIAKLFDQSIDTSIACWLEEFEPGHEAVNLLGFIGAPGTGSKQ